MAIPNNIRQDDFEDIIERATLQDFEAATGSVPQDEKGRTYPIERLRRAYLVSIDESTAIMYYDNPTEKSTPVAFGNQEGKELIVNLKVLADRVTERTKR